MRRHILTSGDDRFQDHALSDPNDLVLGLGGNDVIFSDFGTDTIKAGSGDDRIYAQHAGQFFGGAGADYMALSLLSDGALDSASVLHGGAGQDTLALILTDQDHTYDSLVLGPNESGWKLSLDNLVPAVAVQFEVVSLDVTGLRADNIQFIGGDGNDSLTASTGNIIFFGGNGDDSVLIRDADGVLMLDGGEDNDRLELDNSAGQTSFIVMDVTSGQFTLGGATGSSVFGFETYAIQATAFSDRLVLGDGDDVVTQFDLGGGDDLYDLGGGADIAWGGKGNDTMLGGAGADFLMGEAGNNVIEGGRGGDDLVGTLGNNLFVYGDVAQSHGTGAAMDVIENFLGQDGTSHVNRIDLSGIDAVPGGGEDAFVFVGTAAFTGAGQVRLVEAGGGTYVEVSTQGGAEPDMQIWLSGVAAASLSAADFVL